MSNSPSSPSTPTEKRFRSLKHSKTFTSLSESIRSLRESDHSDVPSTPRTRDVSKSSLFQFAHTPPQGTDRNASSPPDRSPQSVYSGSRQSFSPVKPDDVQRSPRERLQAYVTSGGSPQSAASTYSARADVLQDVHQAEQSPLFLSKRAISSPIPQAKITIPNISLPSPPIRPTTAHAIDKPLAHPSMLTTPSALLSSSLPPATTPRPHFARQDSAQAAEPDPAALVAAAGSTQAAIIQLVKDKQAALTRSEQLWRLVEKQRAMILGLNRDLEAALQEKERYRKRLKEQMALADSEDVEVLERPALVDVKEESRSQTREVEKLTIRTERTAQSSRNGEPPLTPISPDSPLRDTPPRSRLVLVPSNGDMAGRKSPSAPVSLLQASPIERSRKGPPKPLFLGQEQRTSQPSVQEQAAFDSGSDYGDEEITESSPLPNRGRRRTRDDDDERLRDGQAMEDERMSRFEKLKQQSKSRMELLQRNTPPPAPLVVRLPSYRGVDMPVPGHSLGLPSSPRPQNDGSLASPMPSSMSSIGSMMTDNAALAPYGERMLQAPLMSPGLPLSPRPGDRPMNAPQPRMPIKPVRSHPSPPQLPGSGIPPSSRLSTPPYPSPEDVPVRPLSPVIPGPYLRPSFQGTHEERAALSRSPPPPDSRDTTPGPAMTYPPVFRGFASDLYPNLLLPPNALATVEVRVETCRLMPLRVMRVGAKDVEEEVPFMLAICNKIDGRQLWRVEKSLQAVTMVDQALRAALRIEEKAPDKSLFNGQAPARIDARRAALYDYFQAVFNASPMDERTALLISGFFSTDVRPPRETPESDVDSGVAVSLTRRRKEGYLSKKGKSFGGWKARYFVLEGSELQYFEVLGGDESGTINLRNAQIARQTVSGNAEIVEYRHAFMIMEQKRKESSSVNRHILCAETDEERDAWIEALLPYTETTPDDDKTMRSTQAAVPTSSANKPPTNKALTDVMGGRSLPKNAQAQDPRRLPLIHTISYDSTIAAESPLLGASARASWSPATADNASDAGSQVSSQASLAPPAPPTTIIAPAPQTMKKSPNQAKKKRSIFGFRNKASEEPVPPTPSLSFTSTNGNTEPTAHQRTNGNFGRAVFGKPLAEAAHHFSPHDIDIVLPAPVYRCIEFLEARRAAREEGIFRLSGSSTVIKALRERFNEAGDVRLVEGEWDVHVVAGLLKGYLRELPESVLTRGLHLEFLGVIDSENDDRGKILGLNELVRRLPEANIELLATLSRYLIEIVNNSDVNKMSVRNVGIVFSPTLNIPAPLISFFITDHAAIFGSTSVSPPNINTNNLDDMPSSLSPSASNLSFSTSALSPLTPTGGEMQSPRNQYFENGPAQPYALNGGRRVDRGLRV